MPAPDCCATHLTDSKYRPPAHLQVACGRKKLRCHSRNGECFAVACARGLPLHKDYHPYLLSETAAYREGCFSAEISFLVQAVSTQGPVGWGFRGCEPHEVLQQVLRRCVERAVVADHDDMRAPGRHLINMHRIRRSKKLCCHSRNWECFAVACARGLPLHKDEHPYLLSEIAPVTENVPYVRNARLLLESVEAVWRSGARGCSPASGPRR